jgi:hypothetical protein
MLVVLLLLSLIWGFVHHFRKVPHLCAEVARRKGLDERKWYFNGLALDGISLVYLRSTLLPADSDLKRRIDRELAIEVIFVIWFVSMALLIEALGY